MKEKLVKILTPICTLIAVLVAVFFLAPLKDWLAGVTIIKQSALQAEVWNPTFYGKEHCKYGAFCTAWWMTRIRTKKPTDGNDYVIYGGELQEITVTPSK